MDLKDLTGLKVTLSVIKADVGSVGGHTRPSPAMIEEASRCVADAVNAGVILDGMVTYCGDDIQVLMSHLHGTGSFMVHGVARAAFLRATLIARTEGNYAAGQDLIVDAPSGNLKGTGPGVAELEFTLLPKHRPAEAFMVIMADKCGPGVFNKPLYHLLCDPNHNGGLLLSPKLNMGFVITIMDMAAKDVDRVLMLASPEDAWDILALLRNTDRYAIESVHSRAYPDEQIVAAAVTRLHNIAGKYVGKDDPCMIIRSQGICMAPEEIVEPWGTLFQITTGGARGSHNMPVLPVPIRTSVSGIYCLPIVSALGFSMNSSGKFTHNVVDMFDNPSWNWIRAKVQQNAVEFRQNNGCFGIAMASQEELAYTGLTDLQTKLDAQFVERG